MSSINVVSVGFQGPPGPQGATGAAGEGGGGGGLPDWFLTSSTTGSNGVPLNTVTPPSSSVTYLYWDDTFGSGLWITPPSADASAWVGVGTPGPALATLSFFVTTTGPYAITASHGLQIPLTGGNTQVSGGIIDSLSVPTCAYPPGVILQTLSATISGIPSSDDQFDFSIVAVVASLDGTNSCILGGSANAAPQTSTTQIVLGDLTLSDGQIGTDLTFDPDVGLSTTAGGIYGIMAYVNAGWD